MRPYFVIGAFIACVAAVTLTLGCDINPQPEVPSDNVDGTGGEGGAAGATGQLADPDPADDNAYANVDQGFDPENKNALDDAGVDDDARGDGAPPPQYERQDAGIPAVVVN